MVCVSCVFAVSFMLVGMLLMQFLPQQMLGIFNVVQGSDTMHYGVIALRTISLSFILAGFSITISAVFQAFGKSIFSMFVSIARQLVVLLPAAFILAKIGGLEIIWWSFPIAELMSIVVSVIFLIVLWNKTIKKLPDDGSVVRIEDM